MPMERFLGIEANALPPVDDDLTKAYQAQCWVLVHYLLFGRGTESAAQVGRYLSLCGRLPAPSAFAPASVWLSGSSRSRKCKPSKAESQLNISTLAS